MSTTNREIGKRQGQIIVALLWILIPFLGSFVYFFSPYEFSFTDALFESFSGFTTTGSTIIDKPEDLPSWLLIYRSFTQWIGGLGFTLLVIALFSKTSINMNNLFNAEFFSLTNIKIFPHILTTVRTIFLVYTLLTLACFSLLLYQGLNFTDALSHSFSTISTGGFSTKSGNIGAFSYSVQWTIMCFMLLSGVSFFLFVNLFRGRFKSVVSNEQFRYYIFLIIVVSLCFVIYWAARQDMTIMDRIRTSLFYSISMISSTGYDLQVSSIGEFVSVCLLLLMFIGGCSASSSTGLKVIRALILVRFARTALTRIFHPKAIVPVKYNKKSVDEQDIRRIFGFFFLYFIVFLGGVFILSCLGNDFSLSIYTSAANLGNIGPVVGGYIGHFAYSDLNTLSKMFLILLMLLGRLEIYSFLVLFSIRIRRIL